MSSKKEWDPQIAFEAVIIHQKYFKNGQYQKLQFPPSPGGRINVFKKVEVCREKYCFIKIISYMAKTTFWHQPSKSTWSQSDSNPQLSELEYRQYCSYNISSSNNNICVGCGIMVAHLKSQKLVFGHARQSPREYNFLIWKMRNIIFLWKRKTGALPLKSDFNMGSSFKFSKMSAILVITAFSRPLKHVRYTCPTTMLDNIFHSFGARELVK